uniref:Uncharacterized protein n=1 Tax=Eutreptiella gymnastica TaxID=73025 RepID=A0A7S4FUQ8_9EUGL
MLDNQVPSNQTFSEKLVSNRGGIFCRILTAISRPWSLPLVQQPLRLAVQQPSTKHTTNRRPGHSHRGQPTANTTHTRLVQHCPVAHPPLDGHTLPRRQRLLLPAPRVPAAGGRGAPTRPCLPPERTTSPATRASPEKVPRIHGTHCRV